MSTNTKSQENENLPHRLVCLSKSMAGVAYSLETENKSRFIIGRSADSDFSIAHASISGKHCAIMRNEDGSFSILDTKSTNGVYINGIRIYVETVLHDGDVIALGNFEMIYRVHGVKNFITNTATMTTTINLCDIGITKTKVQEMDNFSPFKHNLSKKAGKYINVGIVIVLILVAYVLIQIVNSMCTL